LTEKVSAHGSDGTKEVSK